LLCEAVCKEPLLVSQFFELTAQICGIAGKFEFKFIVALFLANFARKFNAHPSMSANKQQATSLWRDFFIHFCSVDNSRRKFGAASRDL